jgi:hypothetical protein
LINLSIYKTHSTKRNTSFAKISALIKENTTRIKRLHILYLGIWIDMKHLLPKHREGVVHSTCIVLETEKPFLFGAVTNRFGHGFKTIVVFNNCMELSSIKATKYADRICITLSPKSTNTINKLIFRSNIF